MALHPGAHVVAGAKVGIASIAKGLNEVITSDQKIQKWQERKLKLAGASKN